MYTDNKSSSQRPGLEFVSFWRHVEDFFVLSMGNYALYNQQSHIKLTTEIVLFSSLIRYLDTKM